MRSVSGPTEVVTFVASGCLAWKLAKVFFSFASSSSRVLALGVPPGRVLPNAAKCASIWASVNFPLNKATKASVYRNAVTEAAVQAVSLAVERVADPSFSPQPLDYNNPDISGQLQPLMKQESRAIDWQRDTTDIILSKIRCGDGFPGVLDEIDGIPLYLFDAQSEKTLRGNPGALIARSGYFFNVSRK